MILFALFSVWSVIHLLQPCTLEASYDRNLCLKIVSSVIICIVATIHAYYNPFAIFECMFNYVFVLVVFKDHLYTRCSKIILLYLPVKIVSLHLDSSFILLDIAPIPLLLLIIILEIRKNRIYREVSFTNVYSSYTFYYFNSMYPQSNDLSFNFDLFLQHWSNEIVTQPSLFRTIYQTNYKVLMDSALFSLVHVISLIAVVICFKYYTSHHHIHDLCYFIISFVINRIATHQHKFKNSEFNLKSKIHIFDVIFQKSLVLNEYYKLQLLKIDINAIWSSLLLCVITILMLMQFSSIFSFGCLFVVFSVLAPCIPFLFVLQVVASIIFALYVNIHIDTTILLFAILFHSSNQFVTELYKLYQFYQCISKIQAFLLTNPRNITVIHEQPLLLQVKPILEINHLKIFPNTINKITKLEDVHTIIVRGILSYTPQCPFILPGTIKKNILFCSHFQSKLYLNVLHASGLHLYLQQHYSNYDLTVVNDQKSLKLLKMISYARVLYSRANIHIYEDERDVIDTTKTIVILKDKLEHVRWLEEENCAVGLPEFKFTKYSYLAALALILCALEPVSSIIVVIGYLYIHKLRGFCNLKRRGWENKKFLINEFYRSALKGIYSIKGYNKEDAFLKEFEYKLDRYYRYSMLMDVLKHFVELRMEMMVIGVIGVGMVVCREIVVIVLILLL